MTRPPLTLVRGPGPIAAVALHDGDRVRPEVARLLAVDAATRRREQDVCTGELAALVPNRIVVGVSRFEVELNRPRHRGVYSDDPAGWGITVWERLPPPAVIARSLAVWDRFYRTARRLFRSLEARHGRFVVLDLHAYNHRRDGPDAPPADPVANPEINLGTATMDRRRWAPVVDRFLADLRRRPFRGRYLDVRENVKFEGGYLARWVHRTFPETGCVLAIELKKTYVDEWTGAVDRGHLDALKTALAATLPGLRATLGGRA